MRREGEREGGKEEWRERDTRIPIQVVPEFMLLTNMLFCLASPRTYYLRKTVVESYEHILVPVTIIHLLVLHSQYI